MGIGNTMRISLSADPVEEVKVARELLKTFGLIIECGDARLLSDMRPAGHRPVLRRE